jgi:AraC family transcriptional regulator
MKQLRNSKGRAPPPFGATPGEDNRSTLRLKLGDESRAPVSSPVLNLKGVNAQYVVVPPGVEYAFEWAGQAHYFGYHDLRMRDGETFADEVRPKRVQDARGTFTFIPKGCRVWGWTAPTKDQNSFVALYFDPERLLEEIGPRHSRSLERPEVFFSAPDLMATFGKLRRALSVGQHIDALYVESLSLVAAMELCRMRETREGEGAESGRIGKASIARIDEFIQQNLAEQITLDQLAALAGLSRYHFLRAFKNSAGETPYRRVMRLRIERGQELLARGKLGVGEVASKVGFRNPSRFIEAYRAALGVTPGSHANSVRSARTRIRR